MLSFEAIQTYAQNIVDCFQPEKVILFGSYATGQATEQSDVDLLVVLPFQGKSYHMAAKIQLRVGLPPFSTDLLCQTPQMLAKQLSSGNEFYQEILQTGRILYDSKR